MDAVRADVTFADTYLNAALLCRENDITGVFKETFTVTKDNFGKHVNVDLRPGGSSQDPTKSNQDAYVEPSSLYCRPHHRTVSRIHEGLGVVLPLDLLQAFDEHELELLIGGMIEFDMDNWTRFTDYRGYGKTDRVIK